MDIITERAEKGACPICAEDIKEDFKRVLYKGKKVWVCEKHHTPETFNKKAEGGA